MNVRLQAIITELVLEHALRVRMKAGTNEGPESSAANTAIATPASQAGDEESTSDAGDGDTVTEQSATSSTTIQPSSSSSSKGKGKAQSGSPPSRETEAPKAMEKNRRKEEQKRKLEQLAEQLKAGNKKGQDGLSFTSSSSGEQRKAANHWIEETDGMYGGSLNSWGGL